MFCPQGLFKWPDGAVYDGEFVNGQREGHGKYTFGDGVRYNGAWKEGRYDGFGYVTTLDLGEKTSCLRKLLFGPVLYRYLPTCSLFQLLILLYF